jgi:hypothetical protein
MSIMLWRLFWRRSEARTPSGFRLQASGFRLQASGSGARCACSIRARNICANTHHDVGNSVQRRSQRPLFGAAAELIPQAPSAYPRCSPEWNLISRQMGRRQKQRLPRVPNSVIKNARMCRAKHGQSALLAHTQSTGHHGLPND